MLLGYRCFFGWIRGHVWDVRDLDFTSYSQGTYCTTLMKNKIMNHTKGEQKREQRRSMVLPNPQDRKQNVFTRDGIGSLWRKRKRICDYVSVLEMSLSLNVCIFNTYSTVQLALCVNLSDCTELYNNTMISHVHKSEKRATEQGVAILTSDFSNSCWSPLLL